MKKMFSMAIILVMLLSFPAVVYAAPEEVDEHEYGFCDHDHQGDKEFLISVTDIEDERELIEIYVENQDQIMEFYDSSEYDPDYRYSFIYTNPIQPRILCPSCGYNTYQGRFEDLEWGADGKGCPTSPDFVLDVCTYYKHILGQIAGHAGTRPLKLTRGSNC